MGLSNDQKAILRLLSQRGEQGYEDLAALMSIDVAEVHERATAAAAQLESEGIPAPTIPPPPAAGSGEPAAGEPPPAQPLQSTPAPQPPEPKPVEAPVVEPPTSAAAKGGADGQRPKLSLPKSGGARAAIAAGAAVVVLLVVILVLGGDDSDDPPTAASGNGGSEETIPAASSDPKLTQAVLSPVDGGDAKGLATFGRVKDTLALQVEAEGLEPTAKGESYTIWLYESPQKKLPLASTPVAEAGKIGAQVEVPTEVLAYLANETFDQLDISLTSDAALKASLAKATAEKEAPIYTGTDVLRGPITGPIIGAAQNKDGE
jgi:hypothetical protein